jgi:hypothetical protein
MAGYLPAGANHGRRLEILPRGVVQITGVLDKKEIGRNLTRLKLPSRRADAYHQSMPTGEYANTVQQIFETEPVAMLRSAAFQGENGRFPGPGQARTAGQQTTRVPVLGAVNGAPGSTAWDIHRRYVLLGLAVNTGRDSNRDWVNIVVGGTRTITNPLPKTIPPGAYVRARVCTPTELASLRYAEGDAANGANGRANFVWDVYDPSETDFYDLALMRKFLADTYDVGVDTTTKRVWARPKAAPANVQDDPLHAGFNRAAKQLVESIQNIILLAAFPGTAAPTADQKATELMRAILIVHHSGQFFEGATNYRGTLFDDAKFDGVAGVVPTDPEYRKLYSNNPIHQWIRAAASFKMEVEDQVFGRMTIGAPPGCDGEIHLRAYAH